MTSPEIILTDEEVPVIIVDTTEKFASSVSIFLDNDPPVLGVTVSNASVLQGSGAEITPSRLQFTVTVYDVTVLVTSTPIQLPEPVLIPSFFSNENQTAVFTVEELIGLDDNVLVPILVEMNNVNNDITKTSTNTKTVWTATVLENNSAQINRSVVNILTSNYQKFTDIRNRKASKFMINRRSY